MRKVYLSFLMILIYAVSFSQIFITELADPNNQYLARYVELFNAGDTEVDLTGYGIQRYTNGNILPQTTIYPLSGTISAKGFYIIARREFQSAFGFAPDLLLDVTGGPTDCNGDDQVQILDFNDNVIDIFGVPGEDGTGTCHEYLDGRAERAANVTTANNGPWLDENWNTWTISESDVTCSNRVNNHLVNTTDGLFDPRAWIGYTNPRVFFDLGESQIAEDGGTIDVCISITNPSVNATTVELAVNELSTTTNGADYDTINTATITFPPDSNVSQCFTITINDDTEAEAMESIILNLQNQSAGVMIGNLSQHTVVIETNDLICPNVGDIIFTEIMQNPYQVSDVNGEWIEIYNTTGADIDLLGMEITDDTLVDSDADDTFTIMESLIIPAGGYLMFAVNGYEGTNGGLPTPDGVYSPDLWMGNGIDGVAIQCMGSIIDSVIWDDGATFPDPEGASMSLKIDQFDSVSNDNGANWETVSFTYGDGDYGTPGAENDVQLGIWSALQNSHNIYPNPVIGGILTINTNDSEGKQVSIYNISGQNVYMLDFEVEVLDINVEKFQAGIYILKIVKNNRIFQSKIIIK